jgi:hypothetical protein
MHVGHRHLVRAERALGRASVDLLRARPALGSAQHDRRPAWSLEGIARPGLLLNRANAVVAPVERRGERLVHARRIVTLDEMCFVAVALQERPDVFVALAAQHGGTADLVAIEVQDGQHRAVADRVEERGAPPGTSQRPRLRFPVPDHRGDDQIRVVEGGAEGMGQHIAQLAALVNGARRWHTDVAGDTARG